MTELMEVLEPKEWLKLNAQLQKKKSALRAELATIGVLEKKGTNDYDKYKYFSEAQYKELFTGLFSKHGLEIGFSELSYDLYEAAGKNCNGRLTKMEFYLYDTETGFYEATVITGEGADKGDKGGYKAFTGALKYFLADTFMVATGDDAEKDSPEMKPAVTSRPQRKNDPVISAKQVEQLVSAADIVGISAIQICKTFKVNALPEMTQSMWKRALEMLDDEAKVKGV